MTVEMLRGCFKLTDKEMFFQKSEADLNIFNDSICLYISFCTGSVIPTTSPGLPESLNTVSTSKKLNIYKEKNVSVN